MKNSAKELAPVLALACYIAFMLTGWGGYLEADTTRGASDTMLYLGIVSRIAIPAGFVAALIAFRSLNGERALKLFVGFALVATTLATITTADAFFMGHDTVLSALAKGFANASVGLVCYTWCAYDAGRERNNRIVISTLAGIILFFLVSMLPGPLVRALSSSLLALAATGLLVPFAYGQHPQRDPNKDEESSLQPTPTLRENSADPSATDSLDRARVLRGRRIRFYLSRIAWGGVSGLLIALINTPGIATATVPPTPLLVIAVVIIAGGIWYGVRIVTSCASRRDRETAELCFSVLLPMMATGILIVPYLFGTHGIPRMVFFASSLAWMLQAFFRINQWTRSLAIDAPLLVVTEDLTVRAARYGAEFSLIYVITHDTGLVSQIISTYATGIGFLLAFGSVAAATICIAAYLARRYDGRGAEESSRERIADSVALLSEQFGLTPREREVAALLAQGYSRPYIEAALCVSKGTAKTHMYHIYQKVGVQSQDALIDMAASLSPQPMAPSNDA